MQAQSDYGFQQLVTELLRGLADALADRPGETEAQRFARHQTAIFTVMAFLPRDAMETTLASHCVMYDHVLRDAAADLLRSEAAPVKRRIRSQVTAMGRLFLTSLRQLNQLQARAYQQPAAATQAAQDAPPAPMPQPDKETAARPSSVDVRSPTTDGEPVSPLLCAELQPEAAANDAEVGLPPQQLGFQNRHMRRALQFKKPASNRASRHSAHLAAASQSAATLGQRDG